ncbi:MAG: DUF4097 family beta strand repeat protein [Ktedonobacteraceae bacterium]|nr:DUF4097 family beta strand repeat protein [Ktedonobacteraceae bacterium]
MQQNEYMYTEQTLVNERTMNTDPREQVREEGRVWRSRPRKRAPWRTVLFCVLALIVAVGIAELTGGIPTRAMRQALPARTFALSGHSTLVVNGQSGTLHVHAGNTNQVTVQATRYAYGLGNDLDDLQVQYAQQGNTLTITTSESWGVVLGSRGIDIDVTVPSSVDLNIHGSSNDVNLSGIDGQVSVNTDSGNLRLDNVSGPLDLSSSSGDIAVTNEHGPLDAHTSSGNISIDHAAGALDLSSSSGNITLNAAQVAGQGHLQTDSGNIEFSGTLDPRGTYQMAASSGNITLKLPADASFQLATSADSGDVHNDFSASAVGSGPHANIALKTSSGDIRVQKQ